MKIELDDRNGENFEEKKQLAAAIETDQNLESANAGSHAHSRPRWSNKAEFLLSCVGFSVGLGNVWRFPYLAYKNGGGAFLIPYLIMMILCGLPMYYLEVSIGQYYSRGPIQTWRAMCPLFTGIGYAMVTVCFLISIYYNVIIGWILFYLFDSFRKDVPWRTCRHEWDSPSCAEALSITGNGIRMIHNATGGGNVSVCQHSYLKPIYENETLVKCVINVTKRISPSEEYWNHKVLDISSGVEEIGQIRWQLVLTLLVAWIVVYFCMWKGIKSVGKAVYFTATFPYVILIILLVRGLTLPGAVDGILFYIKPQFKRLLDPSVWAAATTQLFYSLGPAWGVLLSLGSYNDFHNNCLKDAVGLVCMDSFTSSLAGFVIFSVLGFMSHQLQIDVEKVVSSGPGLAFMVYPEGIAQMPISSLWAILFFFMLFTLGLDSSFACIECIITSIIDQWPQRLRKRKEIVILCTCIACFCIGLSMVFQGGIYVLNIFDTQAGGISLVFIAAVEVIAVGWFFGAERLRNQVSQMIGNRPSFWWNICWQFITPVILVTMLVFHSYKWSGLSYNKQSYPVWAEFIGWCVSLSSMVLIPIFAILNLYRAEGYTLQEKFRNAIKPDQCVMKEISQNHGLVYSETNPDHSPDAGGAVLSDGYQMMVNESVEQSKSVADKYVELCKAKNIKHVLFLQTADGTPGETIVKIAQENDANVIVMGSRGLGTVRRTLLGSVSDYVLHHAHTPTIVIPPPRS
eukprot:gene3630-4144_t